MYRAIWKGAISFGLVHVPVGLFPASQDVGIDFDWLDKRSMDPVGYKRVNKRTGKEIQRENIVKGIKQEDGDYVVLSEDQIKAAYPKATQTIEIECFVTAAEIPFTLLEKPYYLEPIGKGEKVYALLREAMAQAGVIGIARVVMHSKEHLAALVPAGPALMLNTIRWASEIRSPEELKLPAAGKSTLKPAELKMAEQLIGDMTQTWDPEAFSDQFTGAIHALVKRKIEAGDTKQVTALEDAPESSGGSNVVDLTELLAKSLAGRRPAAKPPAKKAAPKPAAKKTAAAKSPARKRA
ncbi:Ku protein [Pseudorhodoferax sp. Leaf267]|uniref:non-homologous end joining protein Ku n=1 Tax=Pseudorhodoferax sp. Leaf267 TaxID=1736316 RepID=UPI0006FA8155|nr:Ku protein [Pseudorhodoferax sp. Leaf267]KQP23066.1 DNA-binding protein [Pseudorhodoferax sp. Leaf267]